MNDKSIREACGVIGIYGVPNAAALTCLGLHALQHRGQESAGIATSDSGILHCRKGMGLVSVVFSTDVTPELPGDMAIGHVRYSTQGTSNVANAQPILVEYTGGQIAVGHNGHLAEGPRLKKELSESGALFHTSTDSELFLHLIARRQAHSNEEIAAVLGEVGPAYSLTILTKDRLIAARDPYGFRPLVLGRMDQGFVVASETCAFDQIGAEYLREIEAGELVAIDSSGVHSLKIPGKHDIKSRCFLELIYFARPDSTVFGCNPHAFRLESGRRLALEQPADADIVVAIPDSGMSAAMGYAQQMGLPLERGIIRNHYTGRSFIAPGPKQRSQAVHMKHNVIREVVKDKRVVLVDDSLVRGTTTKALSAFVRNAGAKEIHLRIACPPTRYPCRYGIDFPRCEDLLAHNNSVEEIREFLKLESVGYLSLGGMYLAAGGDAGFCTACWTGESPEKNFAKSDLC